MADRLEINKKEKALLIGVIYEKLDQFKVEEHLSELELLATTAGAKVIGKITTLSFKQGPNNQCLTPPQKKIQVGLHPQTF